MNSFILKEGPSVNVTLQWASYRDAADQCSLSRIWGGIHPPVDDIPGRMIGEQIGEMCFSKADSIFSVTLASLASSTISDTIINSYDAGTSVNLNLTFNIPMDTSGSPQIVLSPANLYQVISINQIYWVDSFELQMEMDVNNNILEQFSSLIRIQGLDAGNGMHLPEINLENYFIVDTKLPEITSFIGDLPILSDNDLSNGYQCVIQLDEDCNVNLSPTFVFSGIDYLNPTITENQSNWISAQEYQATFNVADFNENVSSVDVLIENIRDEHGNPLLNPNQSDIL